MSNRIVLGGAQFGGSYGVTNLNVALNNEVLNKLLDKAYAMGIRNIDTAAAYGRSEEVLGSLMAGDRFEFVTKFLASSASAEASTLFSQFQNSLTLLRQSSLKTVLFHDADLLRSEKGDELFSAAMVLKEKGLCQKLGVSVYNSWQIDEVFKKYRLDVVQVPVNVLDQRLLKSGALDRVKSMGVEVHARSIFLQGVLLCSPCDLPSAVSALEPYVKRFWNMAREMSLSPMQACLGAVNSLQAVDKVVIGANSADELEEIELSFGANVSMSDFCQGKLQDEKLLDPRFWK